MSKHKYYAVRKGRKPGIYTTWDECSKQTIGFPGAEFASFTSEEDAQKFMNQESIQLEETDLSKIKVYAFVDGSFNAKTNVYGYGGFLINDKEKIKLQGSGNDSDMAAMRNIAGEIKGSEAAIRKAIELKLPEITIFYDYMGIEMWANGMWQRNKEGTKAYYDYIQSIKDKIKIHFVKVKGHTGVEGNEEADKLAKEAVGIGQDDQEEKIQVQIKVIEN